VLCLFLAANSQAFAPHLMTTKHPAFVQQSALHASTMERLPDSAVKVKIEVPGSATKAAYDKACNELSKTIAIPGFRKGSKIPPQVLEQAMAGKGGRNALKVQAINELAAELIEPALKEDHGLEPIGKPTLETKAEDIAEDFTPGDDLELSVKCDVWPDIQWKSGDKPYMGLKGSYKRKPFDQVKFNKALNDLKERYATLEPIEDASHELQMGDACVVNMEGYMATDSGEKGEKLPDAASGDRVEVIMGEGRYMTGLVEGLVGAKVGDTRTALRDKTLAGKKALFDVSVLEASKRTLPEITDEFANEVKAGLTADSLKAELQKAVDTEDAREYAPARNAALAKALAEVMEVEVPDTLVTNQAREKFAMMMTDMRNNGVADEEIKKQISNENFLKYKKIVKDDIIKDFKVSMATDEIGRVEGIDVPDYQVEEQMESIKQEAAEAQEDFDEQGIRGRVEATLQRQAVMDFLAENAELEVEFVDGEEKFDESLLQKLADETLAREEEMTAKDASENDESGESAPQTSPEVAKAAAETVLAEASASASSEKRDADAMSLEDKAYYALLDAGALQNDN
ncbi:MAG: hypothetical protein SGILL_008260, partial [Bacillariaceae sp.]